MEQLAIDGGTPIREVLLPYARQSVNEEDVAAVSSTLRSDFLTTGPRVVEFEKVFAEFTGAANAVAVSNGTTALHCALAAIGLKRGDEVITTPMTFAATANSVLMQGAKPVFCDVREDTLLINPDLIEEKITSNTKAIIAVDYTGQPCEYDELRSIANKHNLYLIDDACHALGGSYKGKSVGTLADLNTFSFQPTKPLATGEGGMITTDNEEFAEHMRRFRNHGMNRDAATRQNTNSWFYEIEELGYNHRLSDIHCALGISQLTRVKKWGDRRREIAAIYDKAFSGIPQINPLEKREDNVHGYHLYVVQINPEMLSKGRNDIFIALRAENIGVNLHYIPTHLFAFYQKTLGTYPGLCPIAESAYDRILSLPMFADMTDSDAGDVVAAVQKVCNKYAR